MSILDKECLKINLKKCVSGTTVTKSILNYGKISDWKWLHMAVHLWHYGSLNEVSSLDLYGDDDNKLAFPKSPSDAQPLTPSG